MRKTNKFEQGYKNLISATLSGEVIDSRAGATREVFGASWYYDRRQGFPLMTARKIFLRGIMGELSAFLKGATTLKEFEDEGCPYWKDWADSHGYMGQIYGAQWRNWMGHFDQLKTVVNNLVANPQSRRHIVSAWNPIDLPEMALPPCHYAMQFNVSGDGEHLDIMVHMRSLDIMVGFPSDVALYAVLQTLVANETGLRPRMLVFSIGSCHLYEAHLEQALEYLSRPTYGACTLLMPKLMGIDSFDPGEVRLADYKHGEPMSLELMV